MGIVYNPFTSNFDFTGSANATQWLPPVATEAALPTVGNADGDARVTLDTDFVWIYNGASSRWVNQGFKQTNAGSTPNSQGYSVLATNVSTNRTERQLQLQPADATNPGVLSTVAQAIAGDKTFQDKILADGSIDVTATVGTDVLNIGTASADVINLGRTGATINIIGSTNNQNVTNLNVTDKLITINKGGAVASGTNSGYEIEENGSITGYVKTDGTRSGLLIKAPASAELQLFPDPTFNSEITTATLSASRVYTFPDITGTVVLTQGNQIVAGVKTFSGTINISPLGASAPLKLDSLNNVISGLIVDADVSASAAIVYSKLSLSNSIVNADIASAAAIAYSKLALSNSIVNADVSTSAAIVYSKLSLTNSVVDADIATTAAIAYSKLSLTGSIVNADVAIAAAIARTKLASGTANRLVVNDAIGVMTDAAAITAARALISDANGIPTQSTVTSTELGFVSGVTSAIQTQLDAKLSSTLNSANIFVGNISNVATGVTVTGDISIDNTGLTTIVTHAVSAAKFRQSAALSVVGNDTNATADVTDISAAVDGQVLLRSGTTLAFALIANANISASAAIDYSKLSLTGSIVNADVSASAAIVYSKLSLTNSIVNVDIASAAAIAYSKLALSNSIVDADIASAAAIAYSKLSLTGSIVNADISATAAIVYSKLALTGSIVNADIGASAAIAYSKLALIGSIVDADVAVAAAIARTKLASGTANHVLINDGTGVMSSEATLAISRGGTGLGTTPTNGQILIGNGTNYTLTTITAGAGISVTNGIGTITIAATSTIATFGTRVSPISITAGTGITSGASAMSTTAMEQFLYLQGNGGAVTITASPAIQAHTVLGARMTIFGRSDTNTLTIPNQTGLVELNGDRLLGASDSLTLVFDGTAWVETCRS